MKKAVMKTFLFLTLLFTGNVFATDTNGVWEHHIKAWVGRDLDAIASDYSKDSIMIVNNTIYRGPEEIKKVFERLFEIFDDGENEIDPVVIEGRIVYITWRFTPTGNKQYFGTDTFVIENGKIKVQTIASELYDQYPL